MTTAPRTTALIVRLTALAAVTAVVGLLPWLSGRDPALSVLRARSAEQEPTAEALQSVRDDLGLDAGPLTLLGRWLGALLRGDAGTSWVSGTDVLPSVVSGLGVSLTLMGAALLVALPLTAALCARTLVRGARGTLARRGPGNGAAAAMLAALPEFLIATTVLIVLSAWLGWFPPFGWERPEHLVLPALALGVPAGGVLGRLVDDALPGVFTERWTGLWAASGIGPVPIGLAALRRATPALVPQFGLIVVGLTGGAVAVEKVFAIPGLGRTALGAAASQDLPMLQASVLTLVLLGLAAGVPTLAVRRRLLGAGLSDAALSLPEPARGRARPRHYAVPAVLAGVLVAVIGWGLLRDAYAVDVTLRLAAPSPAHPLGTDSLGRDVLARLGNGAADTVGTALVVCLAGYVLGTAVGFVPALAAGASDAANALPPVIVGVLVAAVLGPGALGASIAVALVSWPPLAAHSAALAQEVRAAGYLKAQRAFGATDRWIFWRHVLPAVAVPVGRHAVLRMPGIALALASLGFLGLGAQPPAPEWGLLLTESLPYVERAPWAALAPAVALMALAGLAMSLSTLPARRPGGTV